MGRGGTASIMHGIAAKKNANTTAGPGGGDGGDDGDEGIAAKKNANTTAGPGGGEGEGV